MKERTRRILIMAVMAALIVSLMAASLSCIFTYGRYAGGRRDENSPYEDYIDFVGATAFTVQTPEELTNAIENGYSYIEIDDNAENPFVVNDDIANVTTNLVLDVNGKTVIRNSRNPLLDVKRSVSVVLVYDSSTEQEGGFYNPVGSALQTSGGTLTVGAGVYESGPKTGIASSLPVGSVEATIRSRTSRTSPDGYSVSSSASMPALSKDVYLPKNWEGTENDFIKADTYFIYSLEQSCYEIGDQLYVNAVKEVDENGTTVYTGDALSVLCNAASCDFYYYYPISGTPGTAKAPQDYAVIYGYNDVKALAEDCTDTSTDTSTDLSKKGLVWPYAAIRSEAGTTHARGGKFSTHFGTQNTYGIYSKGGIMTVGAAGSSSAAGPAFEAVGEGVCISMSAEDEDTLTIENGEFSSEIGDNIKMSGGAMTVTAGTFTKNASSADKDSTDNGSAIDIQGGTLNSSESESTEEEKPIQFDISGSYVNGIHAAGGEVNIANASFGFSDGNNNQGIFNNGGTSRARWCDFTLPGDHNYGIHSEGGTTRASDCNITMTGDYVVGVYTTGGRALIEGGSIKVDFAEDKDDKLLTSTAVSTEGGEIYLAGNLAIESDSLGVTVRQGEDTSGLLEIATDTITTTDGTTYSGIDSGNVTIYTPYATGIYVNNGNLTNKGTVTVTSSVGNEKGTDNGWNWVDAQGGANTNFNKYNGIYVQGGSLVSNGTLNVTFTGVRNDSQYIDASGAAVENVQAINNIHHYDNYDPAWENWRDDLDYEHTSDISSYTTAAGIIEANGNLYQRFQTKSYAVRVQNGDVNIKSGLILNGAESDLDENGNIIGNHGIGGGIIVDGGSVTLGEDNGGLRVITTGARMIERQYYWEDNSVTTSEWIRDSILVWEGQYVTRHDYNVTTRNYIKVPGAYQNWAYREPETGGDAVKVIGGQVTVESGHYEAAQGNGILVSGATTTAREYAVEISGGIFVGNDTYDAYGEAEGTAMPGAGASYGLKMYGGSVQITGGRFGSDSTRGSGAFIMGSAAGTQRDATAYITGGTFNVPQGTAGLSVWYGAYVQIEGGTFYGSSAGMTVEDYNDPNYGIIVGNADAYTTIYIGDSITGNTFDGRQDDIWHGGRYTTLSVPRDVIGDIATANGAGVSTR